MVLILSCNYYFNYYFAMAHRILLRADQKIRVIQSVQIVTILVNLADSIIAIELSCGIHAVKLISTLIYLSNPLFFACMFGSIMLSGKQCMMKIVRSREKAAP